MKSIRWSVRVRLSRVLLVVAVAALVAPFAASGNHSTAEAASLSTISQYKLWMAEARAMYPYPQSLDKMYRVMMCESSGNQYASGGGGLWLGLYQYAPTTWRGRWNPYRYNSIYDAKSQIFATAKAWSIGMQSAWSCYYITYGR